VADLVGALLKQTLAKPLYISYNLLKQMSHEAYNLRIRKPSSDVEKSQLFAAFFLRVFYCDENYVCLPLYLVTHL